MTTPSEDASIEGKSEFKCSFCGVRFSINYWIVNQGPLLIDTDSSIYYQHLAHFGIKGLNVQSPQIIATYSDFVTCTNLTKTQFDLLRVALATDKVNLLNTLWSRAGIKLYFVLLSNSMAMYREWVVNICTTQSLSHTLLREFMESKAKEQFPAPEESKY